MEKENETCTDADEKVETKRKSDRKSEERGVGIANEKTMLQNSRNGEPAKGVIGSDGFSKCR